MPATTSATAHIHHAMSNRPVQDTIYPVMIGARSPSALLKVSVTPVTAPILRPSSTNAAGNPLLNAQAVSQFTTECPHSRLILNAFWTIGNFDVNIRPRNIPQSTRYNGTNI